MPVINDMANDSYEVAINNDMDSPIFQPQPSCLFRVPYGRAGFRCFVVAMGFIQKHSK